MCEARGGWLQGVDIYSKIVPATIAIVLFFVGLSQFKSGFGFNSDKQATDMYLEYSRFAFAHPEYAMPDCCLIVMDSSGYETTQYRHYFNFAFHVAEAIYDVSDDPNWDSTVVEILRPHMEAGITYLDSATIDQEFLCFMRKSGILFPSPSEVDSTIAGMLNNCLNP